MKKFSSKIVAALFVLIVLVSCQQGNPKILIIGDSTSLGYTPFVKEDLKEVADVFHNPGNAQHTGTGLENIEAWIGDEKWDIIQFNWGLWDLCYRHPDSKEQGKRDKINGTITFSIDEYRNNLDSIVKLIKKKSDAKLVFVTSTYVPENEAGRYQEDVIRYNQAAIEVMKNNGVEINDIFEKSVSVHKRHGRDTNDVHYSKEGYDEIGKQISNFLKKEIE
ncbi:Lysophospholipase L1 [Mariniphaga anaerophila]|uniref:Lysophospholipase L1 n=1 Tax=Mariniphaga anaerophila TaxID=1484053 RepID=A0A1M4V8H1_9BACT|nr:SGNH/GDSL hydrolase family protein [Mariniphaga anaerophila]SHE65180.1 Lysophospholipase L1 [Mariniphaga anaerophila]